MSAQQSGDEYDYGEILVLQHAANCGPDNLTEILDGRAHRRPWRLVNLCDDQTVPELDERVRGIISLGGRMGVAERDRYPWMEPELDLMRGAVEREVPVLGICLGSQLLAHALGGEVRPRGSPEIGFPALTRTEAGREDTVFAGWPDGSAVTMIHDDAVVELPDGAEEMATGSDGICAWRAGDELSYGVQFHPEASLEQFIEWCRLPGNRPRFEEAGLDPEEVVAEAERRAPFLRAAALSLVGRWVDQVVGRDDPRR